MSCAIHSGGAAAAPSSASRLAAGVRSALDAFLHHLRGVWAYAGARSEFNRLDAGTLRDLGISRSEFDSYWAETHGMADQTRVRVIQRFRSRCGL